MRIMTATEGQNEHLNKRQHLLAKCSVKVHQTGYGVESPVGVSLDLIAKDNSCAHRQAGNVD